jgi:NAD(P)H-quinone oxidoreductase subunit 5
MNTAFSLLPACGPVALLLAGVPARAQRTAAFARAAAAFAFVAASLCLTATAIRGPLETGSFAYGGIGFAFYADRLSAVLCVLISAIGLVVVVYSRNYLDGDPGQPRFFRWLCRTLAAVLLLVVSGNLLQFALAWIATSLCLHHLLIFYRGRPAARLAARKKFVVSRLSDICLIGGTVLLFRAMHSLDIATILAHAGQSGGGNSAAMSAAALLFASAALLKSAQFPVHGWLLEVMETPTPVSALLHAGIINAGGFLVLRFSAVMVHSHGALELLAMFGGFTALYGSLVMLTQTSVKASLAWSTIAQMGFMMLECGLGAFSAALLHIVGHSVYKAHAFLTAGSVVAASHAPGGTHPRPATALGLTAVLLAGGWAAVSAFGANLARNPGAIALCSILVMGLSLLLANAMSNRVIARTLALAVLTALAYLGLQWGAERAFAGTLAPMPALYGVFDTAIVAAVILSFGAVTLFQMVSPGLAQTPRWKALYVHLSNGFYVNTFANRLAVRAWPGTVLRPAARSAGASQ